MIIIQLNAFHKFKSYELHNILEQTVISSSMNKLFSFNNVSWGYFISITLHLHINYIIILKEIIKTSCTVRLFYSA